MSGGDFANRVLVQLFRRLPWLGGVWARLDDETRAGIWRVKGRLLAGAGAAAGVLLLLVRE